MSQSTRQLTVFEPCPKHAAWFAGETLYRSAEVFLEGGPAGSPCGGGLCEMKPGTDFYSSTFVDAHPTYTAELWEPNREAATAQN